MIIDGSEQESINFCILFGIDCCFSLLIHDIFMFNCQYHWLLVILSAKYIFYQYSMSLYNVCVSCTDAHDNFNNFIDAIQDVCLALLSTFDWKYINY